MPAKWALGSSPPGTGFTISRKTFDKIDEYIQDNQASIQRSQFGIDTLVQGIVVLVRSNAMKRSFGPVAPGRRSSPALANRIPVQRITGTYYAGWYVRRIGQGRWAVGNSSFEAYLIETGMFQRTRRPILKMSVMQMLQFLQTTRVIEQFADSLIAPRRNAKGQFQSFKTRMRGTDTLGGMSGPQGRLP